jgi:ATP-dependent exoDNAse (exonuclease V) beta subunit
VDLLFEREGTWRIVEFKTDHLDGSDALHEYAAQLMAYSASLAGVVAAEVKPAICLVRRAEVVAVQ